jgi:hypothetical protein
MKDPKRISDGTDLRAQLLRSARADVVPGAAKARNVAAVVAGAVTLHGKAAAAAALKALLMKAAVVTAVGLAAFGAYRVLAQDETHVPAPREVRASRAPTATPTPLAFEATQAAEVDAALAPRTAPPHVPAVRSAEPLPAASSVRLAEEVAQLDRARSLLLGGDGEGALGELRRYHHDFPAAQLGREAMLLEIDALEKSGRHERAKDLARALIRQNPRSPAAKRLSTTYE